RWRSRWRRRHEQRSGPEECGIVSFRRDARTQVTRRAPSQGILKPVLSENQIPGEVFRRRALYAEKKIEAGRSCGTGRSADPRSDWRWGNGSNKKRLEADHDPS